MNDCRIDGLDKLQAEFMNVKHIFDKIKATTNSKSVIIQEQKPENNTQKTTNHSKNLSDKKQSKNYSNSK